MVGHIVLGVLRRAARLGVGIDAEHREVARLARPHPVVCLAAELTHRLRYGEHQPEVGEVLVCGGVVLVALVERFHGDVQRGVYPAYAVRHGVGHGVNHLLLPGAAPVVYAQGLHVRRYVALLLHEAHEHVLVGQFLGVALGVEAVEHVVVLHGGVRAYGLETAVVVGEHQSVGRHHHA